LHEILLKNGRDQEHEELVLPEINRDELRKLIRKAKNVMQLRKVTNEHREEVHRFLMKELSAESADKDNEPVWRTSPGAEISVTQLCDKLCGHIDLSRSQIYSLIISEMRRIERKRISRQHKDLITRQVMKHTPTNSSTLEPSTTNWESNSLISRICDELKNQIDLPRVLVYALVVAEMQRVSRLRLSIDETQFIRSYIENSRSILDGSLPETSLLTEKIGLHLNLSKQQLYPVVAREVGRFQTPMGGLPPVTKETVRKFLSSTSECDISRICEELETSQCVGVPRAQLHKFVLTELQRREEVQPSSEDIEEIRLFLGTEPSSNIPAICDKLQKRVKLPRMVLYETIRKEINKIQRRKISPEHRSIVKEYVESHPHEATLKNVTQICDRLEKDISIPRAQLYKMIVVEIHKHQRQSLSKEERALIVEFAVRLSNEKGISSICDEIQDQFPKIPRKQLYDVVRQSVKKERK